MVRWCGSWAVDSSSHRDHWEDNSIIGMTVVCMIIIIIVVIISLNQNVIY